MIGEVTRRAWRTHLGHEPPAALRDELARGSLPVELAATARARPGRPALDVDGAAVTHGELDARAARAAGWLRGQGVREGDRVLLAGTSSIELVTAYLAILRCGAVVVPADPGSTPRELAHVVSDSGAVAAWAGGDAYAHLRASHAGAPRLLVGLGSDTGGPSLRAAVEAGPDLPLPDLDSTAVALLAYTSGTTGRPKGVPLTHANLLASIRGAMAAWRWSADDVLVHALPLSHQHGLSGVHATLLSGGRACLLGRFDPALLAGLVARERATVLFAVPAMYERLAAWPGLDPADLVSLRLWVSGSAALSPVLAERMKALLGALPLERYGSTEAGLNLSNPYDGPRRAGRVGLPLPGVEAAVVDAAGHEVADGTDGEIVVRGPQVFGGYWRASPGDGGDAFHDGGWFRTGDVGRADPEDGSLQITGRLKEMIVTGGLNVYPREVELVLEEHAAVERAAVTGVPSDAWGEEVVAAVVLAAGGRADAEELTRHARERVAAYKCPKRIVAVDALPTNRMGKLRRPAVAQLVLDATAPGRAVS